MPDSIAWGMSLFVAVVLYHTCCDTHTVIFSFDDVKSFSSENTNNHLMPCLSVCKLFNPTYIVYVEKELRDLIDTDVDISITASR
jgi:hypothetical protein